MFLWKLTSGRLPPLSKLHVFFSRIVTKLTCDKSSASHKCFCFIIIFYLNYYFAHFLSHQVTLIWPHYSWLFGALSCFIMIKCILSFLSSFSFIIRWKLLLQSFFKSSDFNALSGQSLSTATASLLGVTSSELDRDYFENVWSNKNRLSDDYLVKRF